MRRMVGFLLVVYGVAHAAAGLWLRPSAPAWLLIALWSLAATGFLAAGTGLFGVQWLDQRWRLFACVAALASLGFLSLSWAPVLMFAAAIDGAIVLDAIPFVHEIVARRLGVPVHPPHRSLHRGDPVQPSTRAA